MKTKFFFISGLAAAAVVMTAGLLHRPAPRKPAAYPHPASPAERANLALEPERKISPAKPATVAVENPPAPEKIPAAAAPATAAATIPAQKNSAPPKDPPHDPAARAALSLVGADPDAEAYWLGAIFDSSLPDQEREDLMEDLNEDGLSDPKHPGPQDLPLILNRLALIEQVVPSADDFMLEHLGEAYKDLNNLLAGKRVQ